MSDTCKGCGKPIVWGKLPDGGRIPLDPRPPVYVVSNEGRAFRQCEQRVVMLCACAVRFDEGGDQHVGGVQIQGRWMVSHFATCPKADQFSGSRKSPTPSEGA